jgi:hypothetical protein
MYMFKLTNLMMIGHPAYDAFDLPYRNRMTHKH